jgi:type I restriction enzyme S subunit
MSRIGDLIAELSPVGVAFRQLGDLASVTTGTRPSDADLEIGGPYKYMNGGTQASGLVPATNTAAETITIPSRGSVGIVGWQGSAFWCGPLCYRVRSTDKSVNTRFIYFYLSRIQRSVVALQQTGSIPALNKKELVGVGLPVPPIEVQHEIVRVLDTFTALETELEAELEARRRQYEYYRDSILTFTGQERVRRVALREIGSLYSGLTGKRKADFQNGDARFVTYVNVFNNLATETDPDTFVKIGVNERQNRVHYGDILFTASSETPDEVGMSSGVTGEPLEPLYLNSFCFGFRPNDAGELNPEFAKHLFRSAAVRKQIIKTANGVTRINISKERFREIEVPLPPPQDQASIATLLDRFEALTNDVSIGLPAELRARRQQYEHYRDKLLTFTERVA